MLARRNERWECARAMGSYGLPISRADRLFSRIDSVPNKVRRKAQRGRRDWPEQAWRMHAKWDRSQEGMWRFRNPFSWSS